MAQLPIAKENAEMDMRKGVVVNVGMEAAVGLGPKLCAVRQRTLIYDLDYNVMYTSFSTQYNTSLQVPVRKRC